MTAPASVQDPQIAVGLDLGWRDLTVTPEAVRTHSESVDDRNPWYFGSSPFDGPIAPVLFFHSAPYIFRGDDAAGVGWFLTNHRGTLFSRQEWEFFDAARVGETVRLHLVVVDRYIRRNREYVGSEMQIFGADQRQILQVRTYQSFLADPNQTGTVVDKDREKLKPPVEISTADSLGELTSIRKQVTPEMCMGFSGPVKNYHSDRDAALEMGFPDIVVAGPMLTCFLGQMLTENFGAGFYRGGRMAVRFINPLWGNDAISTRGVIRERVSEGPASRSTMDIWCEKDNGTKTIIGTAGALSPTR